MGRCECGNAASGSGQRMMRSWGNSRRSRCAWSRRGGLIGTRIGRGRGRKGRTRGGWGPGGVYWIVGRGVDWDWKLNGWRA